MGTRGFFRDRGTNGKSGVYCIDELTPDENAVYLGCNLKNVTLSCFTDRIELAIENCFDGLMTATNPLTQKSCEIETTTDCGKVSFSINSVEDW